MLSLLLCLFDAWHFKRFSQLKDMMICVTQTVELACNSKKKIQVNFLNLVNEAAGINILQATTADCCCLFPSNALFYMAKLNKKSLSSHHF